MSLFGKALVLALAALAHGCDVDDDLCEPLPAEYLCSIGYVASCSPPSAPPSPSCDDDLCEPLPAEYLCSIGVQASCSSKVEGDPHFRGAHGDRFDFSGKDDTVYALFSAKGLALNALFSKASFVMGGTCARCTVKTVHGSFMKVAYFRAKTKTGKTLTVEYKADEPSRAALTEIEPGKEELAFLAARRDLGVSQNMPDAIEAKTDDVSVRLARKHKREAAVTVRNGDFEVEVSSRYLGYAEQNGYMKRLDVNIVPLKDVARSKVAPHGLLGQSFDGDDLAVDGAVDDYSASVVVTSAMGEGAIEGDAREYEIPRASPFSSGFKYSRFDLLTAGTRHVAALSGVRRPIAAADKFSAALSTSGDDVMAAGPAPKVVEVTKQSRSMLFSA
jgi:hypothetical protein